MLVIHLESDTLYLYGSPEESAGTEIRGCLELRVKETTRVKSISLQFMGLLKQNWAEGSSNVSFPARRHGKCKKLIYQHDWTFLPESHWPHVMKADTTYRYPFDLVLPGHIAESITSASSGGFGSLMYEFKATVNRPFATKNMVVHRPIQVIRRHPLSVDNGFYGLTGDGGDNSRVINKTFGDKINYRIKLDTDQYQRGQSIRVHFTFKPLLDDLRVEHISCFLKEYTTLTPLADESPRMDQQTPSPIQQQSRIISLARDDRFPCQGVKWEDTETVVVPRSPQSVQLDVDHPWIRIEHKLRLTVRFVQPCGQHSELRVTIPIKVLDASPPFYRSPQLLLDDLPPYEEACLTAPYDPHHRFSPVSPSSSLSSLVSYYDTPSPSYDDDIGPPQHSTTPSDSGLPTVSPCDYFTYRPSSHPIFLQRAPSYSTVIRT